MLHRARAALARHARVTARRLYAADPLRGTHRPGRGRPIPASSTRTGAACMAERRPSLAAIAPIAAEGAPVRLTELRPAALAVITAWPETLAAVDRRDHGGIRRAPSPARRRLRRRRHHHRRCLSRPLLRFEHGGRPGLAPRRSRSPRAPSPTSRTATPFSGSTATPPRICSPAASPSTWTWLLSRPAASRAPRSTTSTCWFIASAPRFSISGYRAASRNRSPNGLSTPAWNSRSPSEAAMSNPRRKRTCLPPELW